MEPVTIELPLRLSSTTIARLGATIAEACRAPAGSVVVLRGEGGHFCRGLDLALALNERGDRTHFRAFAELLEALRSCPRPTLALVEDTAIGGGLGLAAACDVVLADEGCRFALPEVLVDLAPATIYPYLLDRCNPQAIRRLALVGASIDVRQAAAIGLVDEVAPASALSLRLRQWVRDLSRAAAGAVAEIKSLGPPGGGERRLAMALRGAESTAEHLESKAHVSVIRRYLDGEAPWRQP